MAEHGARYTRLVFGCVAGSQTAKDLTETAEIADWLGLELAAMVIEDEMLTTLGGHPGVTLLSSSGAARPNRLAESMERELRAAADAFRRQLEREAARAKLIWSFVALRGRAETVIANTIRHSDIVVYCEPPTSLEREAYPERELWKAVEQSPGAVLYRPSRPLPSRSGVIAISTSSEPQVPVNAVALQLAQAMGEPLLRVDIPSDWQALAGRWKRTPPRLIVLAHGAMGLENSDVIAQAARSLRVPLLVLEKNTGAE